MYQALKSESAPVLFKVSDSPKRLVSEKTGTVYPIPDDMEEDLESGQLVRLRVKGGNMSFVVYEPQKTFNLVPTTS